MHSQHFWLRCAGTRWFVYAKRPFAGPEAVLAYLSRYTHPVVISNSRLIAADENHVTFKVKDYPIDGPDRYTTMTLDTSEFILRFLIHVLPTGFHCIRHYRFFANSSRAEALARARELLAAGRCYETDEQAQGGLQQPTNSAYPCPCCGDRMTIVEVFARGCQPKHQPSTHTSSFRVDTS
jgi:hypothetical protein